MRNAQLRWAIVVAGLLASLPCMAQTQAPAAAPAAAAAKKRPADYGLAATYAQTRAVADAVMARSKELGVSSAVTILGPAGELLMFVRMDNAPLVSTEISRAKAYAAVAYKRSTKTFRKAVESGSTYVLGMPGTIPSEGGLPIVSDGKIIGAVGVSGGTGAQDGMGAQAGVDAIK